ncbi:hypothetical protein FC84_GL000835 [Lapidilactobacillus dextrinicus DSM 20335]|uniref:LXG domain-containing protein n=1 Tax=Lapidilactobacillus dextrinicus DSM 20335 TaxID=1423738 RepID=A0A0R2BHT1_9LACO|nr:hypothetical protein [Lapidilactobacillus dextrinicus]KRM78576.1 hypothetical protein FC84_GL000835 [Lapidilactobacillus dextrinicus DSM 20335]QFG46107.1 hypothetical protein LH506_00920 [Lapidilactobacillus dextrinicus]
MANKLQQKAMRYGTTINQVIEQTEKMQETLDPMFKELKEKMVDQELDDLALDRYNEIRQGFAAGTQTYTELLRQLNQAQAPARLMGNHHSLVNAFSDFVKGCQAMTDSLHEDQTIDEGQFAQAEKDQDDATERLSKYLTKIGAFA